MKQTTNLNFKKKNHWVKEWSAYFVSFKLTSQSIAIGRGLATACRSVIYHPLLWQSLQGNRHNPEIDQIMIFGKNHFPKNDNCGERRERKRKTDVWEREGETLGWERGREGRRAEEKRKKESQKLSPALLLQLSILTAWCHHSLSSAFSGYCLMMGTVISNSNKPICVEASSLQKHLHMCNLIRWMLPSRKSRGICTPRGKKSA